MTLTHKKLLQDLEQSLSETSDKFSVPSMNKTKSAFDHAAFLGGLAAVCGLLSHDASKLAVIFKEKPLPEPKEVLPVCEATKEHALALLAAFSRIDEATAGKYFYKEVSLGSQTEF